MAKTTTVQLATRNGWVSVTAIKPVRGLAVNRELIGLTATELGKLWVVTHISSGTKLPGRFTLRREAVAYCHRLAALADWTLSKSKILAIDGLGPRVLEESRK